MSNKKVHFPNDEKMEEYLNIQIISSKSPSSKGQKKSGVSSGIGGRREDMLLK